MTFTLDAWQPPGSGSYQDVSLTSNYRGVFDSGDTLVDTGSVQVEPSPATAGFIRGALATNQELPLTFRKAPAFSAETFHTNIKSWFNAWESSREAGFLRVIAEDGVTQLRIPGRVISRSTIPGIEHAYRVVVKADQPHFEEVNEISDSSSPVVNSGNVRCGCEVELTGSSHSSASGVDSGPAENRLVKIDLNLTESTQGRVLVNGVPTKWSNSGAPTSHIWAVVNGDGTINIDYLASVGTTDPLANTITAVQLDLGATTAPYEYDNLNISTLIADDDLGGLWKPKLYLPDRWPTPANGWGYYAEDVSDGCTLHLNDTPSFGGSGAYPYNAIYLDSGGEDITSVSNWDVTLADFTSSEALAALLGRQRGGEWEILWSSETNGATTVSVSPTGYCTELMWTIIPLTDTLTTDPSLNINPDSLTTITMGGIVNCATSSTRFKRLNGAFQNTTTGESITFDNFITEGQVDLLTPSRRVDWDAQVASGVVYGSFYYSDPLRGFELAPGNNNISNGAGGSWTIKHRGGYA